MKASEAAIRSAQDALGVADESLTQARREQRREMMPLGFDTPIAEDQVDLILEKMRGNYDASELERTSPKLVRLVAFCLSIDMPYQVLSDHTGLCWEAIQAIGIKQASDIREFKRRNAATIITLIQMMNGKMVEKIRAGQFTVLDWKLLHDVLGQMNGDASQIIEVRHTSQSAELLSQLRGALQMGSEAEKMPAIAAPGTRPALGDLMAQTPAQDVLFELVKTGPIGNEPIDNHAQPPQHEP